MPDFMGDHSEEAALCPESAFRTVKDYVSGIRRGLSIASSKREKGTSEDASSGRVPIDKSGTDTDVPRGSSAHPAAAIGNLHKVDVGNARPRGECLCQNRCEIEFQKAGKANSA